MIKGQQIKITATSLEMLSGLNVSLLIVSILQKREFTTYWQQRAAATRIRINAYIFNHSTATQNHKSFDASWIFSASESNMTTTTTTTGNIVIVANAYNS